MKYLFITSLILFFACSENPSETSQQTPPPSERIDGPANIRAEANGPILFELNHDVEVEATAFKEGWCHIGTYVRLTREEYEASKLAKGSPIIGPDGQAIGKAIADVELFMAREDKEGAYGFINGFTHKNNIQPQSLIEHALAQYIQENGRLQKDFTPFIQKYALKQEGQFPPYDVWFIYENWLTDPSPGFRILLLFQEHVLQGILHSRPLTVPQTQTHPIARGYEVTFFAEVPEEAQQEFVTFMNEWVQSVD